MSFLISTEDARELLNDIGFTELVWEDKTESALECRMLMVLYLHQ
jgi:hypothetical protein